MPDGTVCNPAFLPSVNDGFLLGHAFIGNGYSALATAEKFIFQPISKEFLQELFQKQSDTSLEAEAGLVFTARYFSASFSPYRVQYVSEVHNPNFPVIAIHAALERKLVFSGGVPLSILSENLENFSLGLRLRLFERNYVHGSFSLFQAISEDPRALLPTKNQKGVLFEPSLGWSSTKTPWKLHTSLSVNSIGPVWPEDPLHPEKADVGIGVGIEPPMKYGNLRVGVDLVNLIYAEDFLSRLRLGTSYKLGVTEIMLGLNNASLATGLHFSFKLVQVGIVYEFLRNDFGGISPGSKIATELAVKL